MASVWLTLLLAVLFAQRAHLQDDGSGLAAGAPHALAQPHTGAPAIPADRGASGCCGKLLPIGS